MFDRLKTRWGVTNLDLILILITFALGGSLCGYLAKKLMQLIPIAPGFFWLITYIVLVTLLWPLCVIAISMFTGQFQFFKVYLGKLKNRFFKG